MRNSTRADGRGVALLALATSIATGTAVALTGSTPLHGYIAAIHLLVTLIAILLPTAVIVQILVGQLLIGALLFVPETPVSTSTLALVAVGAVASSELLGVSAQLGGALTRSTRGDLLRAVGRSLLGGAAFWIVLSIVRSGTGAPTPLPDFMAFTLAIGVVVLLGWGVARRARAGQTPAGPVES